MIQKLLTQHAEDPVKMNSLIQNHGEIFKVRNF